MTRHSIWTVLAWTMFGVSGALVTVTLAIVVTGQATADQSLVVFCLGYGLVGALVAVREPRNAVGWLMLTIAVSSAAISFLDSYIGRPGRPGEVVAAWLDTWAWTLWLYLSAMVLPLVFPDGRLLSPRWRLALWLAIATMVITSASEMLRAGPLDVDSAESILNPTGVHGPAEGIVQTISDASNLLAGVSILLACAALLRRLQSSTGRVREQVKLFVYVGTITAAALTFAVFDLVVEVVAGSPSPRWAGAVGAIGWVTAWSAIFIGFPAAIGIAILRHQLYDINVVINRTLVYGSLTVLLLATYLILVLSLRLVLTPLTGKSDLAVAASTLAVAGLFRPARSRIQHTVDRRFFRSRYDAERTLEGFAAQLRSEIDLESLGTDLREVVSDTMHPEHVSLWLRSAP